MRGGKPKPTHLKLVKGNPGRRPINTREPQPKAEIPVPPPELSEDARKEWDWIAPHLHAAGILTIIDKAALAAYCQAYGRWMQAERALAALTNSASLTIFTAKQNTIQHPLVGTANKAMADMVRYAAEFGMTPSGRTRIRAEIGKAPDPTDHFFAS